LIAALNIAPEQASSCPADVSNYTDVTRDSRLVMSWLRAGVPVTLLADLAARGGPLSREILAAEAVGPDVSEADRRERAAASEPPQHGFSGAAGS
jgi:hypothetical protein